MNLALHSRHLVRAALVLLAFPLAGPIGAQAPAPAERATQSPGTDSADVASVIARFHGALGRGDSLGALALLSPDVIILESGGSESLAEYRSHHLPADIAFARAVPGTRGPIRITVRGDVAWAASTSDTRGEFRNRPVSSAGAELMVLTRAGADWRISAIHWSSRNRRP